MTKQLGRTRFLVQFLCLVALGVGLTLATGVVHGHLTQRWGPVANLQLAAEKLKSLPTEIADWQLLREELIDVETVKMLSCAGYINRQYVNGKTGQTVSIAILVGPPGPISVHTPEICYSSRAYVIDQARTPITLADKNGHSNSFWSLAFRTDAPAADRLRVCYAWSTNGVWQASKSPRFDFAGQQSLYKLQIASFVPASGGKTIDPCQDFLLALLQSRWNFR